jgi:ubiquinone/menaquinone biosynthesis C-methylase UbiE
VAGAGLFTHYLSMYSIGFWDSVERGLQEARRVLVAGGRLVILARTAAHAGRIAAVARAVGFDDVEAGRRLAGRRPVEIVTGRLRTPR